MVESPSGAALSSVTEAPSLASPLIQIQPARAEECSDLTDLARASKASWGYPHEWLIEWAGELTITPEYLASASVYVARSDSGLAGLVGVKDGDHGPEIEHLWVSPNAQGRGIGLALVRKAIQHAQERGWTALRILSDPNAEPFYERLGAVRVGDESAPVAGVARRLPVLSLPVVPIVAGSPIGKPIPSMANTSNEPSLPRSSG